MKGKFISYLRKSKNNHQTVQQGMDSNSIEAQRGAIERYLNGGAWQLLAEFVEIESGRKTKRPQLIKALALCAREKATLIISRLDRLARNAAFLMALLESEVKFIALDFPNADRFTLRMVAVFAQKEAEDISARTIAGMKIAKARGKKIGNPDPTDALNLASKARSDKAEAFAKDIAPVIKELKAAHVTSLRGLAQCLNRRGFTTPNGKAFGAQSVKNLLERIG